MFTDQDLAPVGPHARGLVSWVTTGLLGSMGSPAPRGTVHQARDTTDGCSTAPAEAAAQTLRLHRPDGSMGTGIVNGRSAAWGVWGRGCPWAWARPPLVRAALPFALPDLVVFTHGRYPRSSAACVKPGTPQWSDPARHRRIESHGGSAVIKSRFHLDLLGPVRTMRIPMDRRSVSPLRLLPPCPEGSPSCEVHVNAMFWSQCHQCPRLHRMAGDQLHAPRLGHCRQHQEAFHPRKPFAETLTRTTAKGEIGKAWRGSVWWCRPPGGDERFWIDKIARVAMRDVRADEEEGPWGEAIVTDRHLFPRSTRHQPRRGIEPERFRQDHAGIGQLRQIRGGRQPPSEHGLELRLHRRVHIGVLCQKIPGPAECQGRRFVPPPAGGSGPRRGPDARSWDCRRPLGRVAASRAHHPYHRLWPVARQSADRSGYPDNPEVDAV